MSTEDKHVADAVYALEVALGVVHAMPSRGRMLSLRAAARERRSELDLAIQQADLTFKACITTGDPPRSFGGIRNEI